MSFSQAEATLSSNMKRDNNVCSPSETSPSNDSDELQGVADCQTDQVSLACLSLTIQHGSFPWRDITVLENGIPTYFCGVSQYTSNTPDMVWHMGDKSGPVIGHVFIHIGRPIKCGLGEEETTMEWIEMRPHGFAGSKRYTFEWNGSIYEISRSNSGRRSGQYHALDLETQETIATHSSKLKLGMRRNKSMLFRAGMDPKLQLLVVMGFCAWREKSRRRRNAANRQPY